MKVKEEDDILLSPVLFLISGIPEALWSIRGNSQLKIPHGVLVFQDNNGRVLIAHLGELWLGGCPQLSDLPGLRIAYRLEEACVTESEKGMTELSHVLP